MTAEEITNIAKSCINTGLPVAGDSEDSWSFYDGELIQFAHNIFDIGRKAGMEEALALCKALEDDGDEWCVAASLRARMEGIK